METVVKKLFKLETGGKNYLLTENGYSVGLEKTFESGNKKVVVFESYPRYCTNISDLGVDLKLLVFSKTTEDLEYNYIETIIGKVDSNTFRVGNPLNPLFSQICNSEYADAMPEIDFMFKVFMTGEFSFMGIGMNDFIVFTIQNKTGWEISSNY